MSVSVQIIGIMLIILDALGLICSLARTNKHQVKWHEILLVANAMILIVIVLP